ncbi:hypothetical protein Tco_1267457, partial [Tanacetum coccineum]
SSDTSDDSDADFATFMGDNPYSKGNDPYSSNMNTQSDLPESNSQVQPNIRKSSIFMKMPVKFNDNVVGSSRKYRLEKLTNLRGLNPPPHIFKPGKYSKYDYSLLTKKSDNVFMALLVYVDDIVITGNDLTEIEKFKFDGICLSQRKYCFELLNEYGLLAVKHVDTPLSENTTLNHIESDDDHLLNNFGNYQRLFMHAPLVSHLDATMRVLSYLKGSSGSGIQINKKGNLKLRAYADSDWARCPATRKSVFGYCVFMGDSLVTWKSKKQSTLSMLKPMEDQFHLVRMDREN